MIESSTIMCQHPFDLSNKKHFLASASFITTAKKKVIVGWGERSWLSQPGDSTIPYFYFPDFFFKQSRPWCCHPFNVEMTIEQFLNTMRKYESETSSPLNWQKPNKEAFKCTFDDLQRAFATKSLSKAVPYLFETVNSEFSSHRIQTTLQNLLECTLQHPIYAYGFWDDGTGILGGTPELLFQAYGEGNRSLETVACAGTKAAEFDEQQFLSDPKESYEHHVVIQGITESLASLGGKFEIEKTQVLRLARFSHLFTRIHATFNQDISFESIVKGLHPTPALGAWPSHPNGKIWLKTYDQQNPRQRFGAPLGYWSPQNQHSVCMVAIRNVQWKNRHVAIGAGCGIVSESHFEEEWKELQLKIAATKEMLGL